MRSISFYNSLRNLIKRFYGKTIRLTTPDGSERKIRYGLLKGEKWIISSGYSQYWMGNYEPEITEKFVKYAKRSKVIYDIGAHIGYYTLLASKFTEPGGKIFAFEPLPENIQKLQRHVEINDRSNVVIIEKAVSFKTGETIFTNSGNNVANTICENSPMFQFGKTIEVNTTSLDDLLLTGFVLPPQLIKMDIEGAEFDALRGAEILLRKHHPTIFLSTHNCQNQGVHKMCCDYLINMGYSLSYFAFHQRKTVFDDPWYDVLAEYIGNEN
jgi:FkbM family methyltransferase